MLDKVEKPKTLKEVALEQLRSAIMLGQLAPGERLIERTIGEKLGVSRTVVRECIRHLESEHLVVVLAGGPAVAVLATDEIRQIYHIRALLEIEAVKSCTKTADKKTVAILTDYLFDIRKALLAKEVVSALSYTQQFYHLIFTTGGMHVAWELVNRLNGRIGRLRVMTLSTPGRETEGPDNLQEIINGIAHADAKTAMTACQKHIDEACRLALALSQNKNGE